MTHTTQFPLSTFAVGSTYLYTWSYDLHGRPLDGRVKITKRTAQYVTFVDQHGVQQRSKIRRWGNGEVCSILSWDICSWREANDAAALAELPRE